ncbi:helix-turn-helix transcriptional regulator [Gabonibacter massiliensis]|uniref:helix-turn-helix transcriptional regulator n=1 Tax=Gabonibacter massiliensis TaxID=1720195 RepID=UPI00073EF36A|nr:helix-turn-helix transcriptional regulator [Gabonibacter massiliensis]
MRTPIEEYVVNKIKKLRNEFGMSQKEFGDAINLSSGFIGDIEAGREGAKYNLNHINEIAKVFKRSLHEFLPKNPL